MIAVVCLAALAGGFGKPAAYAAGASTLPYDVWQVEEGLEQNPITKVIHTRDGYLWVGTYTGLM
ncbi:MAG TPA: two-component regulator propeller domain-containing protein, partial [Candidatus Acidoferrum sp.]|nr:two-component regulator propeller domain-containing protein [Candidatus Acidoferrum sp.]